MASSPHETPTCTFNGRSVTITFTRPGVAPPVYITTDMSNPPWELQEMQVSDVRTPSGDPEFYLQLHDVAAGTYQYKVRVGPDWILDESNPTAPDNEGNVNNVFTVLSKTPPKTAKDVISELPFEPESGFDEGPLLPHETFDAPQAEPSPSQLFQQSPLYEESRDLPIHPRRQTSLPLETIDESDESASLDSPTSSVNDGMSLQNANGSRDNPYLFSHESEAPREDPVSVPSDETDISPDPGLHAGSGILADQPAPSFDYEDALPEEGCSQAESEDQAPLLPHEHDSVVSSGFSSESDLHDGALAGYNDEQIFDYEIAFETPFQSTNQSPADIDTSGTPSPSHYFFEDEDDVEVLRAPPPPDLDVSPLRITAVDGSSEDVPVREGDTVNSPSSQQTLTDTHMQETDGTRDTNTLLQCLSTPTSISNLLTPIHNEAKRAAVGLTAYGAIGPSGTVRRARQSSSKGVQLSPAPPAYERAAEEASASDTSAPEHNDKPQEGYLQMLLRALYYCVESLFRRIFPSRVR